MPNPETRQFIERMGLAIERMGLSRTFGRLFGLLPPREDTVSLPVEEVLQHRPDEKQSEGN